MKRRGSSRGENSWTCIDLIDHGSILRINMGVLSQGIAVFLPFPVFFNVRCCFSVSRGMHSVLRMPGVWWMYLLYYYWGSVKC